MEGTSMAGLISIRFLRFDFKGRDFDSISIRYKGPGQAHLGLAHLGPDPFGPGPIWAWAHLGPGPFGPGPFGPGPIWALAHLGPGPNEQI